MGTQNVMSMIMLQSSQPAPVVGMGATRICYTDREAYTITRVLNAKSIVVRKDKSRRTDDNGMSDCQTWAHEPSLLAEDEILTLRKDGVWRKRGSSHDTFVIGHRSHFYDYTR